MTPKSFKPCPGCPTPAKCKSAGKCLKKTPRPLPKRNSRAKKGM